MSDERQPQPKTKDVLIREAIANNPFLTNAEIARFVRTNQRYVSEIASAMRTEGFYRGLEREILLEEYFESHPGKTLEDAAEHFKVPFWRVQKTSQGKEWDARPPAEESTNTKYDDDLFSRRVLRPQWYVEEVCGAGYMGVELPDEEFKRYLELREKKRQRGETLRRLTIYPFGDYRGRGKPSDHELFWVF